MRVTLQPQITNLKLANTPSKLGVSSLAPAKSDTVNFTGINKRLFSRLKEVNPVDLRYEEKDFFNYVEVNFLKLPLQKSETTPKSAEYLIGNDALKKEIGGFNPFKKYVVNEIVEKISPNFRENKLKMGTKECAKLQQDVRAAVLPILFKKHGFGSEIKTVPDLLEAIIYDVQKGTKVFTPKKGFSTTTKYDSYDCRIGSGKQRISLGYKEGNSFRAIKLCPEKGECDILMLQDKKEQELFDALLDQIDENAKVQNLVNANLPKAAVPDVKMVIVKNSSL